MCIYEYINKTLYVSVEKPEDRATCIVNGKTYEDGEYFEVKNEPELSCICQPGYEGKNVIIYFNYFCK